MKDLMKMIMLICAACVFIYSMYWLAKTGSYFFFYEGMVQGTIREMVRPEFLQ